MAEHLASDDMPMLRIHHPRTRADAPSYRRADANQYNFHNTWMQASTSLLVALLKATATSSSASAKLSERSLTRSQMQDSTPGCSFGFRRIYLRHLRKLFRGLHGQLSPVS